MKTLLILSLSLISLNAFSSVVGEDKKADCSFSDQSSKREAKIVQEVVVSNESKEESAKSKSK